MANRRSDQERLSSRMLKPFDDQLGKFEPPSLHMELFLSLLDFAEIN